MSRMLVVLEVAVCAEQGIIIMRNFVRSATCSRPLAGACRVATTPRTQWMKGVGNVQNHKHSRQPLEPRAYRRGCGFWGSASGFVE